MSAPLCALCHMRSAAYVCQDCGRVVCPNCFDSVRWSCLECQTRIMPTAKDAESPITGPSSLAMWLLFAAFAIIFIGVLLMTFESLSNLNLNGSGGAVIIVGPIPIILGAGQSSLAFIALAILLTVFVLLFFLLLRKRTR